MTIWLVSRHPGVRQWIEHNGTVFDRHVPHFNPADVQPGDTVIGTLPVNLAAEVCARGASYWNLSLQLPATARGRELSADELNEFQATLERFDIRKI